MVNRFTYRDIIWVDLESPTDNELYDIIDEFQVTPPVAQELKTPSLKPKVDLYKEFIYLILHFPAFKHSHISQSNQEVDFIIGKKFLITVHYDVVDPIHKFGKEFEVESILEKHDLGNHAGLIFFHLIKKLYHSLEHELEFIGSELDEIEDAIFIGKEKEVVKFISEVSRDLLNFKQATSSHQGVLGSFEAAGNKFFGDDFDFFIKDILSEYYKIGRVIENHRESLLELRDTNNSLLSTKQNEAMKILAILAFITFPLSLIASVFGMNTQYLPIVGQDYDFWIILGIMGVLTLIFFLYFRYKDWI
jgi:magnesium transporter